jgi:GT2 family glycosyltransferase
MKEPLVSVVIPNYNGAFYLEACLNSLREQTLRDFEIIVVDNGSHDASADVVRRLAPDALVISHASNLGFAGAVNSGIRASRGSWIAVLNNDTEVSPVWITECAAAAARHPDAAFLACRILDLRTRHLLYSAGDCFLRAGIGYRRGQELPDREEYRQEVEIFGACGCAALYRKRVLEELGGFDERFFAYLEDVDLALRLQTAGYRGYYVPRAEVYHHGAATSGGEFSSLAVFLRTRNALLLLIKDLPAALLWRSIPMVLVAQVFWLARVLSHWKLFSYARGLGGVLPLIPSMLDARARQKPAWRRSGQRLWAAILASETMARVDFEPTARRGASTFLRLYFRLFGKTGPLLNTA